MAHLSAPRVPCNILRLEILYFLIGPQYYFKLDPNYIIISSLKILNNVLLLKLKVFKIILKVEKLNFLDLINPNSRIVSKLKVSKDDT